MNINLVTILTYCALATRLHDSTFIVKTAISYKTHIIFKHVIYYTDGREALLWSRLNIDETTVPGVPVAIQVSHLCVVLYAHLCIECSVFWLCYE